MVALTEGKGLREAFRTPLFNALNWVLKDVAGTGKAVSEGDWGKIAYYVADVLSVWSEVPVLRAYERAIKMLEDWSETNIDGIWDLKEEAGLKKPFKKQKRRRR
jgi:hypothetical protein